MSSFFLGNFLGSVYRRRFDTLEAREEDDWSGEHKKSKTAPWLLPQHVHSSVLAKVPHEILVSSVYLRIWEI